MRSDFYVYVIFRPDGMPCYVGKGCGSRWMHHERKGKCSNHRLAQIIAKADGPLPKVKLREKLTSAEACAIEVAFIAAIGRGRHGPLVNMTNGGEGLGGVPMTDEIKGKIARANKGRRFTEEHRENISKARKAMFEQRKAAGIKTMLSDEHRAAIGRGHKGKVISSDARAKMSAAKKGRPCLPIQRQRLAEYSRNKTPEHRARLAEICRSRNTYGVAIALGNSDGF